MQNTSLSEALSGKFFICVSTETARTLYDHYQKEPFVILVDYLMNIPHGQGETIIIKEPYRAVPQRLHHSHIVYSAWATDQWDWHHTAGGQRWDPPRGLQGTPEFEAQTLPEDRIRLGLRMVEWKHNAIPAFRLAQENGIPVLTALPTPPQTRPPFTHYLLVTLVLWPLYQPEMVPRCHKCHKELTNGLLCSIDACPSEYCSTCMPVSGYCPRHAFFTVEPHRVNDEDRYWVLELGYNEQDGPGYYPWIEEDYINPPNVLTFGTAQEAIDAFSRMSPHNIYLAPDVIRLVYNELESERQTAPSSIQR